jgi:hypothetical protein
MKVTQNFAFLVQRLAALRDDPEIEDSVRQYHALGAVLMYMETLPMTGHDTTLLRPLRQLSTLIEPDLGSGYGSKASYTVKSASLGVLQILIEEGMKTGAARKTIAEILTKCGKPTSARTVRSWTEGKGRAKWHAVMTGTAAGLRAECPRAMT